MEAVFFFITEFLVGFLFILLIFTGVSQIVSGLADKK